MPKFIPRERKHKVLARQKIESNGHHDSRNTVERQDADSNAEILDPKPTEKEQKRHDMRNVLRSQQPKMSAKKQKRLDKYIVRKV